MGNRLLGIQLGMKRKAKIEAAKKALGRVDKPHRYEGEVEAVAMFIQANQVDDSDR